MLQKDNYREVLGLVWNRKVIDHWSNSRAIQGNGCSIGACNNNKKNQSSFQLRKRLHFFKVSRKNHKDFYLPSCTK